MQQQIREMAAWFRPGAEATTHGCKYCDIANGRDEKVAILYEDELFAVVPYPEPASTHHYLVITKQHIVDAKVLTLHEIDFVNRMVMAGRLVLELKTADILRARFGFNWPPFNWVEHLNLHVICPSDAILLKYNIVAMYTPGSPWFRSADEVIERLKKSGGFNANNTGYFYNLFRTLFQ